MKHNVPVRRFSRRVLRCLLVLLLIAPIASAAPPLRAAAAPIIYVNAAAAAGGDGSSWAAAYRELSTALAASSAGAEIWVAAGAYRPTTGLDRSATFALKAGVDVYGGFSGIETMRDQRDWTTNVVTLTGDLLGDDDEFVNNDENSYHVVMGANDATLDGFTITGGYASASNGPNSVGGGVVGGGAQGFMIANTVITVNDALAGGGLYNAQAALSLVNVVVSGNNAALGGGIVNEQTQFAMIDSVISDNTAVRGGGMLNVQTWPYLTNVVISGNTADQWGGGMYNFQGSAPFLTNVVISGNTAESGGGMYNDSCSPVLTNVTMSGNVATYGGAIANIGTSQSYRGALPVRNSIIWGNSSGIYAPDNDPQVSFSLIQGSGGSAAWNGSAGVDGGGNLDADPLFKAAGNLRLQKQSPAINAGSAAVTEPSLPATDLAGAPRIQSAAVDMGAYEDPQTVYVNAAASAGGDGSSWAAAYRELSVALAVANSGDEIWVAAGAYRPTADLDRTVTFALKAGVDVYGGFAGVETARDQRDWTTNIVTLTGDLLGNDAGFANGNDNAYHVVTGADGATLDGFTITGGRAHGDPPHNRGGGIHNGGGSPTLANLIITANSGYYGAAMSNDGGSPILINSLVSNNAGDVGGIFNYRGSPVLTDVTISGNTAATGGGMYNTESSPVLTRVTIRNNESSLGGGIYNLASDATLTDVVIRDNTGHISGAGMFNEGGTVVLTNVTISGNSTTEPGRGGGMLNVRSNVILTNVVISGNSASQAGAMYNGECSPILTNVTISGNRSSNYDGGVVNGEGSHPQIRNSIIWDNSWEPGRPGIVNRDGGTATVSSSLVEGSGGSAAWNSAVGVDGGGNLDANPRFLAASPPAPSLRLGPGSPATDAGSTAVTTPSLPLTDAAGLPRVVNGAVDMGAFERQILITGAPPVARYGTPYSHTLTLASLDTTQVITWTLVSGSLPAGLVLEPTGVLSGVPSAAGIYPNLVFRASNGDETDTKVVTLTVSPAPLTIRADDAVRALGAPNPPFTAQFSGFVLGDGPGVLSSPLVLTTTATLASPAGSYPIIPSGASALNYAITFVPGTLTIASRRLFLPLVARP